MPHGIPSKKASGKDIKGVFNPAKQNAAATAAVPAASAAAGSDLKQSHPNSMYLTSHKDCLQIAFAEAKGVVLINGLKLKEDKWSPEIYRYALQNKITYLADSRSEYWRRILQQKEIQEDEKKRQQAEKEYSTWEKLRNTFKHLNQNVRTRKILQFSKELNAVIRQTFLEVTKVHNLDKLGLNAAEINELLDATASSEQQAISLHDLMERYSAVLKQETYKPSDEEFYFWIINQIIPLINVFFRPLLLLLSSKDGTNLVLKELGKDVVLKAALSELLKVCGVFYTPERQRRFEQACLVRAEKPSPFVAPYHWEPLMALLTITKKTICDNVGHERPDALTVEDIVTACSFARKINLKECADPNSNLGFSTKIVSAAASSAGADIKVSAAVGSASAEVDLLKMATPLKLHNKPYKTTVDFLGDIVFTIGNIKKVHLSLAEAKHGIPNDVWGKKFITEEGFARIDSKLLYGKNAEKVADEKSKSIAINMRAMFILYIYQDKLSSPIKDFLETLCGLREQFEAIKSYQARLRKAQYSNDEEKNFKLDVCLTEIDKFIGQLPRIKEQLAGQNFECHLPDSDEVFKTELLNDSCLLMHALMPTLLGDFNSYSRYLQKAESCNHPYRPTLIIEASNVVIVGNAKKLIENIRGSFVLCINDISKYWLASRARFVNNIAAREAVVQKLNTQVVNASATAAAPIPAAVVDVKSDKKAESVVDAKIKKLLKQPSPAIKGFAVCCQNAAEFMLGFEDKEYEINNIDKKAVGKWVWRKKHSLNSGKFWPGFIKVMTERLDELELTLLKPGDDLDKVQAKINLVQSLVANLVKNNPVVATPAPSPAAAAAPVVIASAAAASGSGSDDSKTILLSAGPAKFNRKERRAAVKPATSKDSDDEKRELISFMSGDQDAKKIKFLNHLLIFSLAVNADDSNDRDFYFNSIDTLFDQKHETCDAFLKLTSKLSQFKQEFLKGNQTKDQFNKYKSEVIGYFKEHPLSLPQGVTLRSIFRLLHAYIKVATDYFQLNKFNKIKKQKILKKIISMYREISATCGEFDNEARTRFDVLLNAYLVHKHSSEIVTAAAENLLRWTDNEGTNRYFKKPTNPTEVGTALPSQSVSAAAGSGGAGDSKDKADHETKLAAAIIASPMALEIATGTTATTFIKEIREKDKHDRTAFYVALLMGNYALVKTTLSRAVAFGIKVSELLDVSCGKAPRETAREYLEKNNNNPKIAELLKYIVTLERNVGSTISATAAAPAATASGNVGEATVDAKSSALSDTKINNYVNPDFFVLNSDSETPLYLGIKVGSYKTVKFIISDHANKTYQGKNALNLMLDFPCKKATETPWQLLMSKKGDPAIDEILKLIELYNVRPAVRVADFSATATAAGVSDAKSAPSSTGQSIVVDLSRKATHERVNNILKYLDENMDGFEKAVTASDQNSMRRYELELDKHFKSIVWGGDESAPFHKEIYWLISDLMSYMKTGIYPQKIRRDYQEQSAEIKNQIKQYYEADNISDSKTAAAAVPIVTASGSGGDSSKVVGQVWFGYDQTILAMARRSTKMKILPEEKMPKFNKHVKGIVKLPNTNNTVEISSEGAVRVFGSNKYNEQYTQCGSMYLEGINSTQRCGLILALSSTSIAVVVDRKNVYVYDLDFKNQRVGLRAKFCTDSHIYGLDKTTDEKVIIKFFPNEKVYIWDPVQDPEAKQTKNFNIDERATSIAVLPRELIAFGGVNGLCLLDSKTGNTSTYCEKEDSESTVTALTYSNTYSLLITASGGSSITTKLNVWRINENRQLVKHVPSFLATTTRHISSLLCLPSGKIASIGCDASDSTWKKIVVVIWDIEKQAPVATIEKLSSNVNAVGLYKLVWLGNGQILAYGDSAPVFMFDLPEERAYENTLTIADDVSASPNDAAALYQPFVVPPLYSSDNITREINPITVRRVAQLRRQAGDKNVSVSDCYNNANSLGENIDLPDDDTNKTALYIAVEANEWLKAQIFCEGGANLNKECGNGIAKKTPKQLLLEIAKTCDWTTIISIKSILEAGKEEIPKEITQRLAQLNAEKFGSLGSGGSAAAAELNTPSTVSSADVNVKPVAPGSKLRHAAADLQISVNDFKKLVDQYNKDSKKILDERGQQYNKTALYLAIESVQKIQKDQKISEDKKGGYIEAQYKKAQLLVDAGADLNVLCLTVYISKRKTAFGLLEEINPDQGAGKILLQAMRKKSGCSIESRADKNGAYMASLFQQRDAKAAGVSGTVDAKTTPQSVSAKALAAMKTPKKQSTPDAKFREAAGADNTIMPLEKFQKLIAENKAIVDVRGAGLKKTALYFAVAKKQWDKADALIEAGANVKIACLSDEPAQQQTALELLEEIKPDDADGRNLLEKMRNKAAPKAEPSATAAASNPTNKM